MLFRADQSGVFDHCAGEGPVDFARRAGAKGTGQRGPGQRGQIYLDQRAGPKGTDLFEA